MNALADPSAAVFQARPSPAPRCSGLPRLLAARPDLARHYRLMRSYRGVSQARQYDVTERCNLRCPGCYFFAWENNARRSSKRTVSEWRAYFQQERDAGVLLAHLAGAEPALVPEVVAAAAQTFPECVVYTNGIVPIDRDLDVRIHVSLWGGQEYHDRAKGVPSWGKIFRNYRHDRRVLLVYTIDRHNIGGIEDSVKAAQDLGVDGITFNLLQFSPLSLTLPAGLDLAGPPQRLFESLRDLLHRLRDDYGHFVVFPHRYNELVVQPGCYVKFRDCVLRQSVRAVKVDGSYVDGRCCYWEAAHEFQGQDRDCECSGYAVTWSQAVRNLAVTASTEADVLDFLDVYDGFLRLLSWRYAKEHSAGPRQPDY